jgi:hypothetical protein
MTSRRRPSGTGVDPGLMAVLLRLPRRHTRLLGEVAKLVHAVSLLVEGRAPGYRARVRRRARPLQARVGRAGK